LRRKAKGRARLTNNDRWFFVQLYRWFPSILDVVGIIQPKTLMRWHRTGFVVTGVGNPEDRSDDRKFRQSYLRS